MKLLVSLIGLVLIFEGTPYVVAPEAMQRWMLQLAALRPGALRIAGLAALAFGLFLCYLTQRTGLFG
jgi:uncharacterized protein YjeT (DUF2065 family)